jgi:hypothetical protein
MAQPDNQQFQKQQVKPQPEVKDGLKQKAGSTDDTKIEKDAGSCGSCGTSTKPQ